MSDPILNECNRLIDKVVEVQNEINDLMELRLALQGHGSQDIEKNVQCRIDTLVKECRENHENARRLALEIYLRLKFNIDGGRDQHPSDYE